MADTPQHSTTDNTEVSGKGRYEPLIDFADARTVLIGATEKPFIVHTSVLLQCDYFKGACKPEWAQDAANQNQIRLSQAEPDTFSTLVNCLYSGRLTMPINPMPTKDDFEVDKDKYYDALVDLYCLSYFLGAPHVCKLVMVKVRAFEESADHLVKPETIVKMMETVPTSCALVGYCVHQIATSCDDFFEKALEVVPIEFIRLLARFGCRKWYEQAEFVHAFTAS